MNFYHMAERFPPVLVRLLARQNGKVMEDAEIAAKAGTHVLRVQMLSDQSNWDQIPLREMRAFTSACRLDFTSRVDVNRIECYLRKNGGKPSFRYLTDSPAWKAYYLPLLLDWRRSLTIIPTTLPKPIQRLLAQLPAK